MKKLDTCINCKVDADTAHAFSALATARGTDASHLLRELVHIELNNAHSQFIALSAVFEKVNSENNENGGKR